mgnify:CR=1 FL=1
MEGFALRDAGDDGHAPLALRPIHLALVAFVATLPAHAPTIGAFAEAPQFEVIADTFLFALLLAAVTSSVVVLLRGLQRRAKCSHAPGSLPSRPQPTCSARWAPWAFCSPRCRCRRRP